MLLSSDTRKDGTYCKLLNWKENIKVPPSKWFGKFLPQGCWDIWEHCQTILGKRLGTDCGLVFFVKERRLIYFTSHNTLPRSQIAS